MALIVERNHVLDIYSQARESGWVIPCFGSENLTTTEAVLSATRRFGVKIGLEDLPVIITLTNLYAPRPQAAYYSHTRKWHIGMKLFMSDLRILTGRDSPFHRVRAMVHLDHVQPEIDGGLLDWDLSQFSSIMYDASNSSFEDNMLSTARFVEKHRRDLVIEGACDEILDAGGNEKNELTTPERAEAFFNSTGVDLVVANLGTEHRANTPNLQYHSSRARAISGRIGPRLVLHGCSSVPPGQIRTLYRDGICKVNIWTALERDAAPVLLRKMLAHAHAAGEKGAGAEPDRDAKVSPIHYHTTTFRQHIVFEQMVKIVSQYLELWYGPHDT